MNVSTQDMFKVKIDTQSGAISIYDNIPDGPARFTMMFDESEAVIRQIQAVRDKFMFIISNPMMNADRVAEALHDSKFGDDPQLQFMCDVFQHSMKFYSEILVAVNNVLQANSPGELDDAVTALEPIKNTLDVLLDHQKDNIK